MRKTSARASRPCARMLNTLAEEAKLQEIVKLIGADVLPDDQKLTIAVARVIREGFLQQNAFHKTDTYMTAANQMAMLRVIAHLDDGARALVSRAIPLSQLEATGIFSALGRMKFALGEGGTEEQFLRLVYDAVAKVKEANE